MYRRILMIALLFVLSQKFMAQSHVPTPNKTTYYYIVHDVDSQTQLNSLASKIDGMKNIDKVKTIRKGDKAQVIIVELAHRRREGEPEGFSILDVKKTIIELGMTPNSFETVREKL